MEFWGYGFKTYIYTFRVSIISQFHSILSFFGIVLLYSGIKMLFNHNNDNIEFHNNFAIKMLKNLFQLQKTLRAVNFL